MGTIVSLLGLLPEALKPDISFKIVSGLCQSSAVALRCLAAVVTAVGITTVTTPARHTYCECSNHISRACDDTRYYT